MGGTVASRYAARYPERVKNLVLSCTHPGYGAPESAPSSEKLEKRLQELAEIGREAYGRNRAQDLLPFPDVPAAVLDYAAEIAAGTNLEGLRRATRMLQLADNRPLLPQLKMPTLILTGEKDTVVQPQLKAESAGAGALHPTYRDARDGPCALFPGSGLLQHAIT